METRLFIVNNKLLQYVNAWSFTIAHRSAWQWVNPLSHSRNLVALSLKRDQRLAMVEDMILYKALYHYCFRIVKRNWFLQTVHCEFATMDPSDSWGTSFISSSTLTSTPRCEPSSLWRDVGSANEYRLLILYSLVIQTISFDFHTGIVIITWYFFVNTS